MYIHDISRLSLKAACQSQRRPDDRLCYGTFTMMRHELNAQHLAENIFKYIFLNANIVLWENIPIKFVSDNTPVGPVMIAEYYMH